MPDDNATMQPRARTRLMNPEHITRVQVSQYLENLAGTTLGDLPSRRS